MPAPFELFTWIFPPGNSKRPVVVRDQEIRIYLRAVAEDGSPGTPTGLRLEVRRPDATIQVIDGAGVMAGEEPGTFYAVVQADQNRLWRYEWIHTGPVEGHMNGSFTVQSGTVQPPGPGQPVLATEDLDPLATDGGGLLRVKRVTALPEAVDLYDLALVGAQAGEARRMRIDRALMTYVIGGVGVPASTGGIPDADDVPAINAGIAQARALGFQRVATRGVVCRIASRVDSGGMIVGNSSYGDVPESETEWRQTPRWVFTDNGWLDGEGGGSAIEDFAANHLLYQRVADGIDPDIDTVAMRAAMTAMTASYGRAGVDAQTPLGRFAVELNGDGCSARRFRLLGFRRSIRMQGARCPINDYLIDGGGTPDDPGVGIAMERSGGAPTNGPGHEISANIKKARGVNGFDAPILAVAQDVATGKTRVTLGYTAFLKAKVWKASIPVAKKEERLVLVSGTTYRVFTKRTRDEEISGGIAPGTGLTLTDGNIGQHYSDGVVDWTYQGLYTGRRIDANIAAQFLLPGHRLVVNVNPLTAALTANGFEELDPGKRGHVALLSLGTGDADAFTYVLDVPWNPAFVTAWAGGFISIYPGLRIGTGIVTDDSDGVSWSRHQSKGWIIAAALYVSNGASMHWSCEESVEGENGRGNPWSIGYYFGPGSAGLINVGGSFKSVGVPVWVATGNTQAIVTLKELFGGGTYGVYVQDGWFIPAGGFFRGGAGRIFLSDKGWADLRNLQMDAGSWVTGTSGYHNRLAPARFAAAGPNKGDTVHGWPGNAVFGPTFAPTLWSAAESFASATVLRTMIGVEGDYWRCRLVTPGVCGTTQPALRREEKQRENSTEYKVGRSVWLIGSDANYHLVTCIAVTGNKLTAASQPAVTDATTIYTDGNSTWQRVGRYLSVGAPINDGTCVWQVEGIETGVLPVVRWDGANRRVVISYVPANGIAQDRLIADDQGVGLGGALRHLDSGTTILTAQGYLSLRSRTEAQLPAGAAGINPLLYQSDEDRLVYRVGTGAWRGVLGEGPRLKGTSTGTTPVRLTTDGQPIAGDRANMGLLVASGQVRRIEMTVRIARTSGSGAAGDFAEWDVTFNLDRPGNANSTRVTAAPSGAAPTRSQGMAGVTLTVAADTTQDAGNNSGASVTVAGVSGVTASLSAWTEIRG